MSSKSQIERKISKKKQQISMPCNRKDETIKGKLVHIIDTLLTERPRNTIGVFDHELRTKKKRKAKISEKQQERQQMMARTQLMLFDKTIDESDEHNNEREEDFEIPLPNLNQLAFLFEQVGVGFSREEMYRIFLSLKELALQNNVKSVRFWGKMFGIKANYIIAETELRDGGVEDENTTELESETQKDAETNEKEHEGPAEYDDLPKSLWKPPPEIPREDYGQGKAF